MPASAPQTQVDSATLRRVMVDRQVSTFDVTDSTLLARMIALPREPFLPPELAAFAYSDAALEVGRTGDETRRLLSPMALARMIQAAKIGPTDRALEVAGGGGYGAAVLAGLCASVTTVDCTPIFAERATAAFSALGIANARATTGALTNAAGAAGPFDVVLVGGAVETAPTDLLNLLSDGGRLVAIDRSSDGRSAGTAGMATVWRRTGDAFGRTPIFNASAPVLTEFSKRPAFAF